MGGKNVTPTTDIVDTPQDQEALDKARNTRKRFNFQMLGIDEGTVLEFKKDSTITCIVANETQINFRNELTSLSLSANTILKEMGYDWAAVAGPSFWCVNGMSLHEMRLEAE